MELLDRRARAVTAGCGRGRRTHRVPGRGRAHGRRSDTKSEYFYDYAGQDPINSYDLTGAMTSPGGGELAYTRGTICQWYSQSTCAGSGVSFAPWLKAAINVAASPTAGVVVGITITVICPECAIGAAIGSAVASGLTTVAVQKAVDHASTTAALRAGAFDAGVSVASSGGSLFGDWYIKPAIKAAVANAASHAVGASGAGLIMVHVTMITVHTGVWAQ